MKKIQIFLGGGVKLLHGDNEYLKGYRNDVVDPILSQLNSQEYAKHLYIAKDYSDLTRNVVKGKQQEVYNYYIVREAQVALFIIDGEIGNITKHEIDVAVSSTKKSRHPIVYVYGRNIEENDEILEYLNQEGIYFQHFFDNRDLATKIRNDLDTATKRLDKQRVLRTCASIALTMVLCGCIMMFAKTFFYSEDKVIENCSAQLYLMRYRDLNALIGTNFFSDSLLSSFKYEDSVMTDDNVSVFPIIGNDSVIPSSPPFFRLKLHNKHRNTIVFVEAKLEIDNYIPDTVKRKKVFIYNEEIPDVDIVNVESGNAEYSLKSFRQNLAYGETDDRYFFCLTANENCSFRMRVKAKSQLGDYLYSNYVYVNFVK